MKPALKHFVVHNNTYETIVQEANTHLRIIVTEFQTLTISHQIFTEVNLAQVEGKTFKKISELFIFLQTFKKKPEKWSLIDSKILSVKGELEIIKMPLKILQDPTQICKMLLLKVSLEQQPANIVQGQMINSNQGQKKVREDIQILKANYNTVGTKLKGIGQIVENIHQRTEANSRSIDKIQQTINAIKETIENIQKDAAAVRERVNVNQKNSKQQVKRLQFQIDISQKNMLRNYETQKIETQKQFIAVGTNLKKINQTIQKNDFPKMRIDMDEIRRAFESQIKVNPYDFIPDQALFKVNRKLHWINNKIKNVEDVKDYNKMVGTTPFGKGISKFRIAVVSIKNNGLLFGICSRQAKQNLSNCKFNDPRLVCLNSCGYIINRGSMIINSAAKIKSLDTVKMLVNKSQSLVRWFCNDIEIAVADMGYLSKEEIYPIIGLGNFNDEVQILDNQQLKQSNEHFQTYTQQLEKINEKFGRSKKSQLSL